MRLGRAGGGTGAGRRGGRLSTRRAGGRKQLSRPLGPGTQPVAASLCHPPQHRSTTRRRLVPASPRLPPPGLGCPPRDAPSQWEDREARGGGSGSQRAAAAAWASPHIASRGVPSVLGLLSTDISLFFLTFQLSLVGSTLRTPSWRRDPSSVGQEGSSSGIAIALIPFPQKIGSSPIPGSHLRLGARGEGQAQAGFWWELLPPR